MIGPLNNPINLEQKLVGYKDALEAAGIGFQEEYVIEGDETYESGVEVWKKFHDMEERPTAIIAGNDDMAIGIMNGAQDEGVSIPNELEIISSDDTKLATMVRPQLSSISQPLYDIGAVAMRLLTKYMNKGSR